jgi:hypothetical protein
LQVVYPAYIMDHVHMYNVRSILYNGTCIMCGPFYIMDHV